MTTLTITAQGRITLPPEVLQHLGVDPGGTIEVESSTRGRLELRAAGKARTFSDFVGFVQLGPDVPHLTLDEMKLVIEKAWAGEGRDND